MAEGADVLGKYEQQGSRPEAYTMFTFTVRVIGGIASAVIAALVAVRMKRSVENRRTNSS